MITVVCYNHKETWESRENAIKFYKTGMYCCDPKSSECRRYATIVNQLSCRYDYCCDDESVYSEIQAKEVCDSCTQMNPKDEATRMASL